MKLKLFTAALALGLAASASAATTRVAYDESSQTVTTITDTAATSTVTASSAGVLSNASSDTNWPETTVTFTLDLDALQSYVDSGESEETGTLTLVSITTSKNSIVGVGMSSDGSIVLLNGSNTWYTTSTTLSDLVSSGLTTLAVETGYASSGTSNTGTTVTNRPYTWLAAAAAEGSSVTTISNIVGLGATGASAYVSSVSVDSSYVTSFSVTNAPLSLDSAGVGAAAVALAAAVPEPATATLGLLALGALALRRRRA